MQRLCHRTAQRQGCGAALSILTEERTSDGYWLYGSSYDTQTGQMLLLDDVARDTSALLALAEAELNGQQADDLAWTLDYNGVTFYSVNKSGIGYVEGGTVTISFAQHPEVFEAKYMTVPDFYMVRFLCGTAFNTDLNGDGATDKLTVEGLIDEENGYYVKYFVCTDLDEEYYYSSCLSEALLPYYVKTAEGKHFLYLFSREGGGDSPDPFFSLEVFDISGGHIDRTGFMYADPGYTSENVYAVPTDPTCFYLDYRYASAQGAAAYAVGADGLPVLR